LWELGVEPASFASRARCYTDGANPAISGLSGACCPRLIPPHNPHGRQWPAYSPGVGSGRLSPESRLISCRTSLATCWPISEAFWYPSSALWRRLSVTLSLARPSISSSLRVGRSEEHTSELQSRENL